MVKSPERAMIAKKVLNTTAPFSSVREPELLQKKIPWSFSDGKIVEELCILVSLKQKHTNKKETFAQELKNKNNCLRPNLSGAVCAWGCKWLKETFIQLNKGLETILLK